MKKIKEDYKGIKGIYSPRLILKAYKMEKDWLKSINVGEDELAPQLMFFIIENDEIMDTKLVNREDVKTYISNDNEYYLDRVRDSEDILTDYNLEPVQKLVDNWNSIWNVNEGMWESPFTMTNAKKIADLLSKPITYSEIVSDKGKKELWNVIGDDSFWDEMEDLAYDFPDNDARDGIATFLKNWIKDKKSFKDGAYDEKAANIIKDAILNINEDYDDDCEDIPEEMQKERYVTYFETQEGRQKYTIYHVYTDSTDDSYNELCDKRDNQLGMYNSYKELKDALKERAEKIAAKQGWTVKSIENLGEDDTYYRERNKFESIKEGFKIGDTVQLKRKNNKKGIVKSIFNGDKDKNDKDIKYLDVEFEDGTKEGRPASDFRKINESLNEGQSIKKWAQSMLPEIFKLLRKNGIPSKDYCVLGHVEICPNANFLVRKTDVEKVLELLPMAKENEYWDTNGNAASIRIEYDGLREFEKTLKSKNEEKEMNEDIKTEYAIITFLKKYGFATQEDLYNNIGAQVFVIDNAVKELLKQDKIKFEDGQGQDGINGWKLTEQIEEDLATLEKKMDKTEQDLEDMLMNLKDTTNESIFVKLNKSIKEALDDVGIDTHQFKFTVYDDDTVYLKSGAYELRLTDISYDIDKDDLKEEIEDALETEMDYGFGTILDGDIDPDTVTGTEIVKFKYDTDKKEGEFEFNIFYEL